MPTVFNNTTLDAIVFNNVELDALVFNGTTVWESLKNMPPFTSGDFTFSIAENPLGGDAGSLSVSTNSVNFSRTVWAGGNFAKLVVFYEKPLKKSKIASVSITYTCDLDETQSYMELGGFVSIYNTSKGLISRVYSNNTKNTPKTITIEVPNGSDDFILGFGYSRHNGGGSNETFHVAVSNITFNKR